MKNFLLEQIKPYKKKAIVYHSFGKGSQGLNIFTKQDLVDVVKKIKREGFIPGGGAMYGKGIYTVYRSNDLRMAYGRFALIFEVKNLDNFLIFNYSEAKKVYGKKHRLIDQLTKNKVVINEEISDLCKQVDTKNRYSFPLTSKLALKFSKIKEVVEKIDGIIFEGATDGAVLVGYETKNFTLIGYGEKFPTTTSSYAQFIYNKPESVEVIKNVYKPKSSLVDRELFASSVRDLIILNSRTADQAINMLPNLKDGDYDYLSVINDDDSIKIIQSELSKEDFEIYKKYKEAWDEPDEDPEELDRLETLYYKKNIYKAEEKVEEMNKSLFKEEVKNFYKNRYLKRIIKFLKLDDNKFTIDIKELPDSSKIAF
tara:strand:- start:1024 stop:2130 length:1107 start_codon:yes stop_codon:yes gene_type:complete